MKAMGWEVLNKRTRGKNDTVWRRIGSNAPAPIQKVRQGNRGRKTAAQIARAPFSVDELTRLREMKEQEA